MEPREQYTTEDDRYEVRDARTEQTNRFLPGYITDQDERESSGVIDSRFPRHFLCVDFFIVGTEEAEMLAIADTDGNTVQWRELQEILDAVRPFYDRVSPEAIERFNTRPRPISPSTRGPNKTKAHPGFVYVLQAGPYYKIGASSDPTRRLDQLTTLPPFDLDIIHIIQTREMYDLESELHERFSDKRKNGEWFELTPTDVEYIKGL